MANEYCNECIMWNGDSSGVLGECTNTSGAYRLLVGRYESCMNFLARDVQVQYDLLEDL